MNYSSLLSNLEKNKDRIIKDFGNQEYSTLVSYYGLKSSAPDVSGTSLLPSIKTADAIFKERNRIIQDFGASKFSDMFS